MASRSSSATDSQLKAYNYNGNHRGQQPSSSIAIPIEKTKQAVKERFQCNQCGQIFTNYRNARQHHWCIADEQIDAICEEENARYEQETRELARQHLANEAAFLRPPSNVDYSIDSPPLHILGHSDARIEDGDSFSDVSDDAESPTRDPLSHEPRMNGQLALASTPPRQGRQPESHGPSQRPQPNRQLLPPILHPHPPLEPRVGPAIPARKILPPAVKQKLPPINAPKLPPPTLPNGQPLPSWYYKA